MTEAKRPQGPNVKKLIVRKMSLIAVPPGGGPSDAMKFLMSKDSIISAARESTAWVFAAIDLVKAAPDNTYGDDDEAIAAEILRGIDTKKADNARG